MYIDSHVHFRDFNQTHKETVRHGLEVARDSGLDAVFDMPNTDPPIMTRELVVDRLKLAREANVPEVFYGIHMGLTKTPEQIKRAVDIYIEFFQVIGIKLYAGHSVENLGIIKKSDQRTVYKTLVKSGYKGVLTVHCEKESEMIPGEWNPTKPRSHCFARPEKSEIESVRDQIMLAQESGFNGKLHIAHISAPGAVDLVVQAKEEGIDISCEICPHHFIYDWHKMTGDNGIRFKMNPPLRKPDSKKKIFQYLRDGKIDWIATDHAPHTLEEKTKHPFMSGLPGLPWWNMFDNYLQQNNFPNSLIEKLTHSNVLERFEIDIPKTQKPIKDRTNDYSFNPYEPMAKELGWKL